MDTPCCIISIFSLIYSSEVITIKETEIQKKGALYIRVSTHGRQEELSPDAQKRLLLEYAEKNNILISKEHIYIEKGISGKTVSKRPEFQKMISDAKSEIHPFDMILIWKFSRFARNQEESIVYKSLLRSQYHVDVQSISEPLSDGPFGSLIERIIEWMDEFYSINLSGEVTRGMTEKALHGGFQSRPPFGYRIAAKGSGLSVVPEEARIVKLIYEQFLQKHASFLDIARNLNACNIRTASGGKFESRSVSYILRNPVYCGKIYWKKTSHQGKPNPREEWICAEGTHPCIISEELFFDAQKRMELLSQKKHPCGVSCYLLSGILKCPSCGGSLCGKTIRSKGNTYCYYRCSNASRGKCLHTASLPAKKIESALLDTVVCMLAVSSTGTLLPAPASCSSDFEKQSLLEHALQKISQKKDRIRIAYQNGVDSLEEYRIQKEQILENEKQILKELSSSKICCTNSCSNSFASLSELLSDTETDVKIKNRILRSIVYKAIYDSSSDKLTIWYECSGFYCGL